MGQQEKTDSRTEPTLNKYCGTWDNEWYCKKWEVEIAFILGHTIPEFQVFPFSNTNAKPGYLTAWFPEQCWKFMLLSNYPKWSRRLSEVNVALVMGEPNSCHGGHCEAQSSIRTHQINRTSFAEHRFPSPDTHLPSSGHQTDFPVQTHESKRLTLRIGIDSPIAFLSPNTSHSLKSCNICSSWLKCGNLKSSPSTLLAPVSSCWTQGACSILLKCVFQDYVSIHSLLSSQGLKQCPDIVGLSQIFNE